MLFKHRFFFLDILLFLLGFSLFYIFLFGMWFLFSDRFSLFMLFNCLSLWLWFINLGWLCNVLLRLDWFGMNLLLLRGCWFGMELMRSCLSLRFNFQLFLRHWLCLFRNLLFWSYWLCLCRCRGIFLFSDGFLGRWWSTNTGSISIKLLNNIIMLLFLLSWRFHLGFMLNILWSLNLLNLSSSPNIIWDFKNFISFVHIFLFL